MGAVTVAFTFEGSVHEAEQCWYDTRRWPMWVDGLESVVDVRGDWPRVGSEVIWQSGPAGRGRVRERVVEFEALAGARLDVEDESIRGSQTRSRACAGDGSDCRL